MATAGHSRPMELGIYTFVEHTPDRSGTLISPAQRVANLLEEAQLADEVGLDCFNVGEHHRADYLASAPAVHPADECGIDAAS